VQRLSARRQAELTSVLDKERLAVKVAWLIYEKDHRRHGDRNRRGGKQ
jgi:hypothetical protein